MKKSLIALAALAAAGVASAQSSVTLFGIVDATYAHGSADGGTSKTSLTNSGYNSSRLGFRGTEDLGGGMSASFWLEMGMNNDNGTGGSNNTNNQTTGAIANGGGLMFNRRSTVSLAGGWGEVRLGRDYTPQFWNLTVFDPFGTNGVGTTQLLNSITTANSQLGTNGAFNAPTAIRASNAISYFLPGNLGGFYGQAMYYLGENNKDGTATEKDGNGFGLRAGYAAGPFNVAVALSKTKYATGDIEQNNVGGQWDFGFAKLQGLYSWDSVNGVGGGAADIDGRGWQLGTLVPVGAGEIRASYGEYKADAPNVADPKTKKFALGYVHNLSKRTAVYATWARVSNDNGARQLLNGAAVAAGVAVDKSSGYDFGVRHSF